MPVKRALKTIARVAGIERKHAVAARMYCERHALATVGRTRRRTGGRILAYHTVSQPDWGLNDVTTTQFRRQIELAHELGYRFVAPSEIARTGGAANELAITFDDGMTSVYSHAAPILKDYGLPYAFFPVTDWADGKVDWIMPLVMTWDQIGELVSQGAEIGSHSATHPNFGQIDHEEIVDDLGRSHRRFKERLGFFPKTLAIPLGQSMNWKPEADRVARELGYETIYAQAEETRPPGTIPRTFVSCFDNDRIFKALLKGKYDSWEEWS